MICKIAMRREIDTQSNLVRASPKGFTNFTPQIAICLPMW